MDAVVQAMRWRRPGGTANPGRVESPPPGSHIQLVRARTSAMDVAFRGSYVGIGAAAFNAQVAAARHSLLASLTEFPDGSRFGRRGVHRLVAAGPIRHWRTLPGRWSIGSPIAISAGAEALDAGIGRTGLHAAAIRPGAQLHLITDRPELARSPTSSAESDRIRFLTPLLHRSDDGRTQLAGRRPGRAGHRCRHAGAGRCGSGQAGGGQPGGCDGAVWRRGVPAPRWVTAPATG